MSISSDRSHDIMRFFNHELKTPVHGMKGLLCLLKDSGLTEQQKAYVESLEYASDNLQHSVLAVLDYFKLNEQRLVLENHKMCIFDEINDFIAHRSVILNERGLKITVDIASNVPKCVKGDAKRLHFILRSIFNRISQYVKKSTIQLKISVLSLEKQGYSLDFSFWVYQENVSESDRDPKEIENELESFDEKVAYRLANLMGGLVYSQTEGVYEVHGFKTFFKPHNEIYNQHDFSQIRILVVEDEAISRKIAVHSLKKMGYQVDFAVNGRQAVDLFAIKDFDLILMDIQMPVLEGLDATREIREIEIANAEKKRCIILAFTADSHTNSRIACINAGMDDYISKPLEIDKLLAIVEQQLS